VPKQGSESVNDFGQQWNHFPNPIDPFHSSVEIFVDTLQGLYDPTQLQNKRVLEIGSGSGRVLEILRQFDPEVLVGVEPSSSAEMLSSRFSDDSRVRIVRGDGTVSLYEKFDVCFLIGVLHHIPEPIPVLANIRRLLSPDGALIVWVYGREGRARLGVLVIQTLRVITIRLPDAILVSLSKFLTAIVRAYGKTAKRISWLPLAEYLNSVFMRCTREKQIEIIFDQLNPRCARFYTQSELRAELMEGGFTSISVTDRHGYSISAYARA